MTARAESPPPCPSDSLGLGVDDPGYARKAQGYAITVTDDSDGSAAFANVSVVLTPADGSPPTSRAVTLDPYYSDTNVILQAPAGGSTFDVALDWDQDSGTQAACHGHKAWTDPLVPAGAKIGDPFAGRLAGRYKARYRPLDYSSKPFTQSWRLTPLCEYFACSARMRSSGGWRGKVRFVDKRGTTYQWKIPTGRTSDGCTVIHRTESTLTGEVLNEQRHTVPRAFLGTLVVNLRVTKVRDGRAVALVGKDVFIERPTPAARRKGCHRTFRYHDAVRVQAP